MTYKAKKDFSVPHVGAWKKGDEVRVNDQLHKVLVVRDLLEEEKGVKKNVKKEQKKEEADDEEQQKEKIKVHKL